LAAEQSTLAGVTPASAIEALDHLKRIFDEARRVKTACWHDGSSRDPTAARTGILARHRFSGDTASSPHCRRDPDCDGRGSILRPLPEAMAIAVGSGTVSSRKPLASLTSHRKIDNRPKQLLPSGGSCRDLPPPPPPHSPNPLALLPRSRRLEGVPPKLFGEDWRTAVTAVGPAIDASNDVASTQIRVRPRLRFSWTCFDLFLWTMGHVPAPP